LKIDLVLVHVLGDNAFKLRVTKIAIILNWFFLEVRCSNCIFKEIVNIFTRDNIVQLIFNKLREIILFSIGS